LEKISEDCPHKLDLSIQGANLLDHLVPQFINFTDHQTPKIRLYALQILQALSAIRVPATTANIDAYIQALFRRAADPSSDVRRAVCAALGLILGTRPDKLVPEMKSVVDYMAYCTRDNDETVALEACEFWLTFAEDAALRDHLRPFLPQVAPLLLQGMVYSEYDLMVLDVDEEDEAVPDKETDIKPKTYSSKVHSHESNDPSSSGSGGGIKSREAADRALDEDEDEDDDDDYDDDEGVGEWNIRKCSAAALDVMAVSFGNDLLEILLPHLKDRLFSDEWEQRESGILAMGAIAEGKSGSVLIPPILMAVGCIQGLEPHLPQLVPWLIQSLKDKKVRR
jgi:transportin-1